MLLTPQRSDDQGNNNWFQEKVDLATEQFRLVGSASLIEKTKP